MKRVLSILLFILTANIISAQTTWLEHFADLERYNSYEKVFITDNLPHNILSNELQKCYYQNLSMKQYIRRLLIYDHMTRQMLITCTSRKAGSGYLFVNQKVSEAVDNTKDKFIVNYYYNGRFIETAMDVRCLVKLRRKQIRLYDIDADMANKVVSVYIYDKKYQRGE